MSEAHASAFTTRPRRVRAFITACVVAAFVLPVVLPRLYGDVVPHGELLTAATLLGLSVVNVEIGRLLDGGVRYSHRPHKALSAWAFGAALLLPTWWVLPVVVTIYAHARWRGLRLPLWKWVGSGAFVVLAALAAGATAEAIHGSGIDWVTGGPRSLAAIAASAAVFLLVETALFHVIAYLNDADDEQWLRRTLHGRRFYATEGSMLLIGALSAAVWAANPWLLVLLLPAYGLAQQAALHEPLQQEATTDTKTGVYRYEFWRRLALAESERCAAKQRPWAVVFADLDQFKPYNDTWGHLAGDTALVAVADLFRAQLRSRDLVGRFGGEEFCLFLSDATGPDAVQVAERLRAAVEGLRLPDTGATITMSLGVASTGPAGAASLAVAIQRADAALYRAKEQGRNAVFGLALKPEPAPEGGGADAAVDQARGRTPAA